MLTAHEIYDVLERRRLEIGLSQAQASTLILGRKDSSFFQGLRRGSIPSVSRFQAACKALGLEFYFGPPRGNAATVESNALPATSVRALESSARTLNRVVVDSGGDPIPEDIWPVLAERRGLAEIPALGATVGDSPSRAEGADENTITLAFADVRAAAGSGEMVFEEAAEHRIAVPRAILPRWVQPSGLICIRAAGDSMTPTLNDGDLILLDHKNAEPRDKQVFVIHTGDGLVVKRLREDDGAWEMISDNPVYSSRQVGETDRVIGRVAWSGPLKMMEARG